MSDTLERFETTADGKQSLFPGSVDTFGDLNKFAPTDPVQRCINRVTQAVVGLQSRGGLTVSGAPDNEVVATLSTSLAGANNDLVYTSVLYGELGNSITVRYVDPGANNQQILVSVSGYAITVTLGTGVAGAITSTSQDVKDEIESSEAASALVTIGHKGGDDGSGVVIAMAASALTGGVDAFLAGNAPAGSLVHNTSSLEVFINTGTLAEPYWARYGGQRFHKTVTLTSAAAATAVELVPNEAVGTGRKVYLQGYLLKVDGATDWGTTANIKIQDKNSSAVDFVTLTASALDGNEIHGPWSDSATLEDAFSEGTGGTSGKGLQVKGNANGTGSDIKLTVWGVIQ